MPRLRSPGLALLFTLVSLAIVSCRREAPSNVDRNLAPETYVTLAPAESLVTTYRAHLYWSGRDPDGQVAYYEIAVTDSNRTPGQDLDAGTGYTKTLKTDSTFVFKAVPPTEQQLLGYRFFVRAVDNEGKADATPAVAYFVARNDNYPTVVFRPGLGTWKDRFGNSLTRILTSTDPDAPTDTIGVEGCFSQAWGGFDEDAGGFVTGFDYKLASQLNYGGGSLADTFASYCFPAGASRKQVLQVRAVDDGGLRSAFDFTRSVIVNFDPNTIVVHPTERNPDGTPVPGHYFIVGTQVWRSGTTLADQVHDDVAVFLHGLRRRAGAAADVGYRQRRSLSSRNAGSIAWTMTRVSAGPRTRRFSLPGVPKVYPQVNMVTRFGVGSGDTMFLIRARDKQNVPDSTPDTVLVSVNYRPYIVAFKARPESEPESSDIDLLNRAAGDTAVLQLVPGEKLLVTVRGSDIHVVNPPVDSDQYRYDHNTVVENEHFDEPASGGYRVYFNNTVTLPGFDLPTSPPNFTAALDVDSLGTFLLIADVRDQTNTNETTTGRKGTAMRLIRLEERVK